MTLAPRGGWEHLMPFPLSLTFVRRVLKPHLREQGQMGKVRCLFFFANSFPTVYQVTEEFQFASVGKGAALNLRDLKYSQGCTDAFCVEAY